MVFIFTLMLLASGSTLSLARPQVVAGSESSATGTISTISAICPPGTWSSIGSTSGFVYTTVLICFTATGSISNGICSQISATNSGYGPGSPPYPTVSATNSVYGPGSPIYPTAGSASLSTSATGTPASSNSLSGSPISSNPASGNSASSTSTLSKSAISGTGTTGPIPSNTVTGKSASSISNSATSITGTTSLTSSNSVPGNSASTSRILATTSSTSSLPLKSASSSSVTSTTSTSTTATNSLSAVQAQDSTLPPKCTNGATPDASCFNALDLPDYIINWYKTADCGSLGFADCFYAKKTNYAPSKCDQLNGDAACTKPIWDDFKNNFNGPEDFYVAWNIWNTNGFFLDMYTAIGDATQSCANGLAAIIALLDPPTSENVVLDDILDAITFGLSLYAEGSILMKALLRSAPQTAGLLGKLFPSGTVDGEYQDWTVISQKLGQVTDSFRASVADGLPLIQDNITSFISWSQSSGLSGFRPPLNGLTDSMALSLNTYAISQIIQSQGIVVSRAPDTDVHALQTNGSKLNWNTGCSGGYTNGVCDTFFWDGTDTYGLTDPNDFTKSYHDQLSSMFQNLTTGALLFTGARKCGIASGKNGGGAAAVNGQDPTQFSCLSNMQICTWDESGYGPFVDCPNLPAGNAVLGHFGVSGCIGSTDDIDSTDVPRAYLGPGVYQNARNIQSLQADSWCDNIPY